jgi:transposase
MGRSASPEKVAQVIELANEGHYVAEIARRVGLSHLTVTMCLLRAGVTPPKCKDAPKKRDRAERMASMFRQGLTLTQIGEHFGVTRQRVEQVLRRDFGIKGTDGGANVRAAAKKQAKQARLDAASLVRWGMPFEEARQHRRDGSIRIFESQRNCAKQRGIAWHLSFAQWLEVWNLSGKWELRGRGKGRYCMSRIKDSGGYEVGNVHIQLSTENNSQGVAKVRGNRAANIGVWKLYPKSSKPWVAKVSKALVGTFATEAEAVAARNAFIQERGIRTAPSGRAYRCKQLLQAA